MTESWSLSHNSSCWLVEREIDSVRLSRLVLMLHSFSFVKWVLGQGLYHSPKFKYCILKIPGEDQEGEKVSSLHHRHPWDLGNLCHCPAGTECLLWFYTHAYTHFFFLLGPTPDIKGAFPFQEGKYEAQSGKGKESWLVKRVPANTQHNH